MTVMRSSARTQVTAAQVRAAMFGQPVDGVRVVRQAWRLTDSDSDELALIDARGIWWVARRLSDRLAVWVYIGDEEAEEGFESLVRAVRAGEPAWHEARASLLRS